MEKATASAVMKPATLKTGLVIQVPPFVNAALESQSGYDGASEPCHVQRVE